MKTAQLLFSLMIGLALLPIHGQTYSHQENLDYLISISDSALDYKNEHQYLPETLIDSLTDIVRTMNIKMTPYKDISAINKEFKTINDRDNDYYCGFYLMEIRDFWKNLLLARLEFHLSNPITFYQLTDEKLLFSVAASPDGKYKFYGADISGGTMYIGQTFYQYLDTAGHVVCKEWQEERRFDSQPHPVKVWQFDYHDSTFYVLKSFWGGSSREWGWDMEIVTFDNGTPQYHSHFFPGRKGYSIYSVCYTCHSLDVDYDFDPKTLTITAQTQDDNHARLITKRWQLQTDK